MPEPWNTIIALAVGLPLCAVVLGAFLAAAFAAACARLSAHTLDDDDL